MKANGLGVPLETVGLAWDDLLCTWSFSWLQNQSKSLWENLPDLVCQTLLWKLLHVKLKQLKLAHSCPDPLWWSVPFLYVFWKLCLAGITTLQGPSDSSFSQLGKGQTHSNSIFTKYFHWKLSFWKVFISWTLCCGIYVYIS